MCSILIHSVFRHQRNVAAAKPADWMLQEKVIRGSTLLTNEAKTTFSKKLCPKFQGFYYYFFTGDWTPVKSSRRRLDAKTTSVILQAGEHPGKRGAVTAKVSRPCRHRGPPETRREKKKNKLCRKMEDKSRETVFCVFFLHSFGHFWREKEALRYIGFHLKCEGAERVFHLGAPLVPSLCWGVRILTLITSPPQKNHAPVKSKSFPSRRRWCLSDFLRTAVFQFASYEVCRPPGGLTLPRLHF